MYKLIAVPALFIALTGCAANIAFSGRGVPLATLYVDSTVPYQAVENNLGKKRGEACATSILGLVTTGDASIRAAADAGGVRKIGAVDNSYKSILGIVATYCTIVSGTGGND